MAFAAVRGIQERNIMIMRKLERLSAATKHLRTETTKAAIRELLPEGVSVAWDVSYPSNDQGESYRSVDEVHLTLGGEKEVFISLPDLNDLLCDEVHYWLENIVIDDEAAEDALNEAEDTDASLDVAGKHFFGRDDGRSFIPRLFGQIGQLVDMVAEDASAIDFAASDFDDAEALSIVKSSLDLFE